MNCPPGPRAKEEAVSMTNIELGVDCDNGEMDPDFGQVPSHSSLKNTGLCVSLGRNEISFFNQSSWGSCSRKLY